MQFSRHSRHRSPLPPDTCLLTHSYCMHLGLRIPHARKGFLTSTVQRILPSRRREGGVGFGKAIPTLFPLFQLCAKLGWGEETDLPPFLPCVRTVRTTYRMRDSVADMRREDKVLHSVLQHKTAFGVGEKEVIKLG